MSDYISREYLLNHWTHIIADGLRIPVIELDTVINAPAVEPERPKGKWRWRTSYGIDRCKCSMCGLGSWEMEFNYCPFCGARMEKNA